MNSFRKIKNRGFTLIEVLVAITIFSIIMISVMMIYSSANNVSRKIDINRVMQENTKTIVEMVAKDILDYGIIGASAQKATDDCSFSNNSDLYKKGDKLCLGGAISYFLAKNNNDIWSRIELSSIDEECGDISDECVLVKQNGEEIERVSNSFVSFRDLKFYVSDKNIKKVTVNFTMQASSKKGINPNLLKNSKIIFQTTLSERLIKTNEN